MTIEVYTVNREGMVSPPRATVSVPYGYEPTLEDPGTQFAPCSCPTYRNTGGAAR